MKHYIKVINVLKKSLVEFKIYFNKGHVHRLDGPAYISYLHDGKICYQSYFIDNISYNDELQFLVAIENFKNKEENYFE